MEGFLKAIGTERQRAVIAAFKVRPEAPRRQIAAAAGVTVGYVMHVLRDYRESRLHEDVCPMNPVGEFPRRPPPTKPAETDVAPFAADRRFGGNAGPAACTVKQQACRTAMAMHPQAEGEPDSVYGRRIALVSGLTAGYIHNTLSIIKCERIGAEARAMEAKEAKNRCEVIPFGDSIGPVQNFRGWTDVFSKFKILSEAYLNLARDRGDVYAAAFLKDIQEISERAQCRASMRAAG
jgi:hypothetical protein